MTNFFILLHKIILILIAYLAMPYANCNIKQIINNCL